MASSLDDGVIVPIEVRPGEFIRVALIPHDLTKEEAEKICRVVMAYVAPATPSEHLPSQSTDR